MKIDKLYPALLVLAALFLIGCQGGGSGGNEPESPQTETSKDILTYALMADASLAQSETGTISGTQIEVAVPQGTDLTALVAEFTHNGDSVTVNGLPQESGVTANDFSAPLTYLVTALDGSTQEYTVTVSLYSMTSKEMTSFGFEAALNPGAGMTSDLAARIEGLEIMTFVDRSVTLVKSSLIPFFTTTGESVSVGGVAQVSNETSQDFTGAITYRVTARDASTQDYSVSFHSLFNGYVDSPLSYSVSVDNTTGGNFAALASASEFPDDLATDGRYVYVAGGTKILRIDPADQSETVIGGRGMGICQEDLDGYANGIDSYFWGAESMTLLDGNLYISDRVCHSVLKLELSTGIVTFFAGGGYYGAGFADGVGTAASFMQPGHITTDGTYLYVADTGNGALRRIDIATATVTTLLNSQTFADVATGTALTVSDLNDLTSDGVNLYFSENFVNTIKQMDLATNTISVIVGTGLDGVIDGIGTAASINHQSIGLTTDGTYLYFFDYGNYKIRRVNLASMEVTTILGPASGVAGVYGLVWGRGTDAGLDGGRSLIADGTRLYVGHGSLVSVIEP